MSFKKVAIVFISSIIFSCSEYDYRLTDPIKSVYHLKTIDNKNNGGKKTESEFKFNLKKEKIEDDFVVGTIKFKEIEDVNVKMNLSEDHLQGVTVNTIDDKNLEIKDLNGSDYQIKINQIDKHNAILSFMVDNESFDIAVMGEIDVNGFIDLSNISKNASAKKMAICGGVCIGAVVTIVGGAYCAWRSTNDSNNCTGAFKAAVDAGNDCSMEFESGWCGGDCNITCN